MGIPPAKPAQLTLKNSTLAPVEPGVAILPTVSHGDTLVSTMWCPEEIRYRGQLYSMADVRHLCNGLRVLHLGAELVHGLSFSECFSYLGAQSENFDIESDDPEKYGLLDQGEWERLVLRIKNKDFDASAMFPACSTFGGQQSHPCGPTPLRGPLPPDIYGFRNLQPGDAEKVKRETVLALRCCDAADLAMQLSFPFLAVTPAAETIHPSVAKLPEWAVIRYRPSVQCRCIAHTDLWGDIDLEGLDTQASLISPLRMRGELTTRLCLEAGLRRAENSQRSSMTVTGRWSNMLVRVSQDVPVAVPATAAQNRVDQGGRPKVARVMSTRGNVAAAAPAHHIGDLRNIWKSVEQIPNAIPTGCIVRDILDEAFATYPSLERQCLDAIGKAEDESASPTPSSWSFEQYYVVLLKPRV